MGKGIHFEQVAVEWRPGERVRWLYRFSDDSVPPNALDEHVEIGGMYFDILDTEYALQRAQGGTTLSVRMSYRVSTQFNWYARPLADYLIGNFEDVILKFYARRAESAAGD